MALKSNLKTMLLSLTLVCLVCSAALAVVYSVTAEPIAAAQKKAVEESVGAVLPQGLKLSPSKPLEVGGLPSEFYEASSEQGVAAYAVKSAVNGFGGALTLMVGITADGKVYATKVLSHSETPGLGAKCETQESFYGQFRGFDPSAGKLLVTKDGGSINAITAATITSRAYTLAVQNALDAVQNLNKE